MPHGKTILLRAIRPTVRPAIDPKTKQPYPRSRSVRRDRPHDHDPIARGLRRASSSPAFTTAASARVTLPGRPDPEATS